MRLGEQANLTTNIHAGGFPIVYLEGFGLYVSAWRVRVFWAAGLLNPRAFTEKLYGLLGKTKVEDITGAVRMGLKKSSKMGSDSQFAAPDVPRPPKETKQGSTASVVANREMSPHKTE